MNALFDKPTQLSPRNLGALVESFEDSTEIMSAFTWIYTKQGAEFWADFHSGENLEEGRLILAQYLRDTGRYDLLPQEYRGEPITEKDIEEMI